MSSGPSSTIFVRRAETSDLTAIRELIPDSVRALSRDCYSAAQIESALRHVFGPDTQLIADQTYFVVTVGDRLAGCGGWSRWRKLYGGDQLTAAAATRLDPKTEPARIRAFFVAPEFARQGIGTRILQASLEAAAREGFRAAELVATLPGEQLYAMHGFTVVERITDTLPDGVTIPFVRMRRDLTPPPGP